MKKKMTFIIQLSMPFLLTVAVPLIAVFFLGNLTIQNYTKAYISSTESNIRSAFDRFVTRIDSVESLSYIIGRNTLTTQYALSGARGVKHTVEDNRNLSELLQNSWITDDVMNLFYYDTTYRKVAAPSAVLSNAEEFFRYSYRIEGLSSKEAADRYQNLSGQYGLIPAINIAAGVNSGYHQIEVIEFHLPLPINTGAKTYAQLVCVMDTGKIFRDLYDILDSDSEFYLYNNKGTLLFSNGDRFLSFASEQPVIYNQPLTAVNNDLYSMSCSSPDKNLYLKVYIPNMTSAIANGISTTRVILLMIGVFFSSTLLTVLFTMKKEKQIRGILELLTGKKKVETSELPRYGAGYKQLREYAYLVVSENNHYRESIQKYETSRKYLFLNELVQNTCRDLSVINKYIEDGILPSGKQLVVCYRYFDENINADNLCEQISDKAALLTETTNETFLTAPGEITCTITVPANSDEISLSEFASRFFETCTDLEVSGFYIGISNIVDSIFELNIAYSQAILVLQYETLSGNNLKLFSDLKELSNSITLSSAEKERLKNSIISCDYESASGILYEIHENNFGANSRLLSIRAIEALKGSLKDTLLAVSEHCGISIEDELVVLDDRQDIHSFFEMMNISVTSIIKKISSKNNVFNRNSAKRIMDYVNAEYCNPNLCVKQISGCLGLHENYISSLFYEEYHEHLSAFIERKRIEKACNLLRQPDLKIAETAALVGYSSDISFRRAFKKNKGVSPREYREKCMIN